MCPRLFPCGLGRASTPSCVKAYDDYYYYDVDCYNFYIYFYYWACYYYY